MKIALLVIDMQKGSREGTNCKAEFDNAANYINGAARLFRSKDYPVIFVQDKGIGNIDSEEFKLVSEIVKEENDLSVYKYYNNSFWETDLDNILKEKGIEFLVISGFAAEYCVLFTYNGAKERGYRVALLQNGIAGIEKEEIKNIQLLRPVISLGALAYFISNV